ncbi:hypothetical protein ACHAXA_010804 [Cyclostephanos tholiformis]|uniref:Uncharacterized protein n=1 Tax=Cyclostephanos tholiformis TaxID=382380 RepID=A0ABD3R557_9STRA
MFCSSIRINLQRCFGWRLNLVQPTPRESDLLDTAEIKDSTLRSYVVWRRSQMICAILPLLLSMLLSAIKITPDPNLNSFGNLVNNLPFIGNLFILISLIGAIGFPGKCRVWTNWRLSKRIIRFGFIVSFILPIIPAFIPLQLLTNMNARGNESVLMDLAMKESLLETIQKCMVGTSCSYETNEMFNYVVFKLEWACRNFVKYLPALNSFPASLSRGSLSIKGLLPKSSLSSWMLAVAAPFQSLIILASAMLIIQSYSSATLLIGVFLLATGPLLHVFRRGLYVKAPDEQVNKAIDCNQCVCLWFRLLGVALIVTTALMQKDLMSMINVDGISVIRIVLETWGRTLGSAVVFSDILLRMTVTNWSVEKSLRTVDIDAFYQSIERSIWKKIELEDGAEWGTSIPGESA